MDADSAGEYDEDYNFSGEDNQTDEAQTEGADSDMSDDIWMPAGRRGTQGSRRRGRRDNIKEFICDDEEDSEEERKKRRRPPPARRQTRTSALATQASLRKRCKKFGFSSSEESLATTPCSSSTEEEEAAEVQKRRRNRWNNAKTYSGRSSKEPPKKGSPKKKKKKRKRIADYNSEASTEESSEESEDEYVPPGGAAQHDQEEEAEEEEEERDGSDDEAEEGSDDEEKEEGIRRVNNRLESSTEDEEDEEKSRGGSKTPDSAAKNTAENEAKMESEPVEDNSPKDINENSDQKAKIIEGEHDKNGSSDTALESTAAKITNSETMDDNLSTRQRFANKQSSDKNKSSSDNNSQRDSAQKLAAADVVTSTGSTPTSISTKLPEISNIPSSVKQDKTPASENGSTPPTTETVAVASSDKGNAVHPQHKDSSIGQNPKKPQVPTPKTIPQRPPINKTAALPGQPSFQQGYVPNMPIRPQAFMARPRGPPMNVGVVRPVGTGPPMMGPMNGQSAQYYHPRNAYMPQQGLWQPPVNPVGSPHLNTVGSPPVNQVGGQPPSYPLYTPPHAPVPIQRPTVGHHIPIQQSQTSNTFMVDNLLHSDDSAAPNKTMGGLSSSLVTPATAEAGDDDDEMSSYMTMANSLVSGGTSK